MREKMDSSDPIYSMDSYAYSMEAQGVRRVIRLIEQAEKTQ